MAHCASCQVLFINGLKCHERGCPDQWKDEIRECKWCGTDFSPESAVQTFCEHSCYCSYHGIPNDEDYDIDPDEEFELDQREEDEAVYQNELSRQLQKFR